MMKIIVQKFGGTSVKDAESRKRALHHIKRAVNDGYKVVTVVSAMGRNGDPYATDTLLGLVDLSLISNREQDILLSCGEKISAIVFSNLLKENQLSASAMTGGEAGFITSNDHTNAKIIDMKCDSLYKELENHEVVVVAGFQGVTKTGEITTLGRGGSDTSASALGAALKADWIDIFTDVEGIMTADPRIVKDARPLTVVTYEEICNMAHQGAKVIHPRAVEIAMQANVPIRVRSTYSDSPGTLVTSLKKEQRPMDIVKDQLVTGIAHMSNISQITVHVKEFQGNIQAEVFNAMAKAEISVDFINISPSSIVYTVDKEKVTQAVTLLEQLGYDISVVHECAKVSAVGAGIAGVPGVTAKIVNALAAENVQILQSADSHTTIWVLVREKDLILAVNALHKAFRLEEKIGDEKVDDLLGS
jgi:aspartate kinase